MKIAIMGAGLSGLACALTLEKYGCQADVFEKRGLAGDRFIYAEAMFSMFHHPIDDAVSYLSVEHGIHLKPSSTIQKTEIWTENERSSLNGHLGYVNMRGKHPAAYEKQLADQLQGKIRFHQDVSHTEISKEYTHTVLATGDSLDTEKIQPYKTALTVRFIGAIVAGEFDITTVHTFFNNLFAPKGMAYLLPHSVHEASLILVYPQYPENEVLDKDELWENCLVECRKRLNQNLALISMFELENYRIGTTETPRIGNTFFVGNCFGSIMPFLGFGQLESILTGIYAAQAIAGKGNYEDLVRPLYKSYHDSLSLRRGIEKLDNKQLDFLAASIRNPLMEKLLLSKRVDGLKIASRLIHPFQKRS
ncbi:NAD(P)-binding protein [Jeotgalibacillus campisalis]|uniref:FAD-dependent oxidoreductase n=1 Tax=Jeotgalibacillus campisalis TaxID=220754 RepID=A0A0C2VWT9_9BACL|nr:NAD(P)-binding protein [Jeotgalibacillus campisalis]KIL48438.1 FAD-dependent oxidoreductase [Jeotgalibacillus campisalis]